MATGRVRREPQGVTMPPGRKIPREAEARAEPVPPAEGAPRDPEVTKAGAELAGLVSAIRACEACRRASARRAFGSGHPRARIMLLKERPSDEDLHAETAFASEAEALQRAFDRLGIPFAWIYGTTAVRCATGAATTDEAAACASHLLVEIEAVQPSVIVVFGPRALNGLQALHGRCGIELTSDVERGVTTLRPGLAALVTEPLPEGVTDAQAKRRLWRDLQKLRNLLV